MKLTERDITRQVRDFLEYRGWRSVRMNVGMATGTGGSTVVFGERGMPDFLFLHYYKGNGVGPALWIEFKCPGATETCRCRPGVKKLCRTCGQKAWRLRERARGGVVWRVDDLEDFAARYERSYGWLGGQKRMEFEELEVVVDG